MEMIVGMIFFFNITFIWNLRSIAKYSTAGGYKHCCVIYLISLSNNL